MGDWRRELLFCYGVDIWNYTDITGILYHKERTKIEEVIIWYGGLGLLGCLPSEGS